jgi:hypothetical protein
LIEKEKDMAEFGFTDDFLKENKKKNKKKKDDEKVIVEEEPMNFSEEDD